MIYFTKINEFILFIFYLLIKAGQKPAFNHIEEQNYLEFIEKYNI